MAESEKVPSMDRYGELKSFDPTWRMKARDVIADYLQSLGIASTPQTARKMAEGFTGSPDPTADISDSVGVADITPLGIAFGGQEIARQYEAAKEPLDYAGPTVAAGLMVGGPAISKFGKQVVGEISDLLKRANKKFDPEADPAPEPDTLEYQAEELGEQFKALLETGTPEEVKRNLEFYDPDTLMTSAMRIKKPEFDDEFQASQWVLSSPETHRKLNPEIWYDDPKHALENLKVPEEIVLSDIDKVLAYDTASARKIPEAGQRSYEGWRQLPMYQMEYDPYSNALFVRAHEGRHINRALELQGKGQLNYLTEIDKLAMDEFPDLKTLDPKTPVFSDSRREYIDAEGNRRFSEPEKIGTLGDLFKVVYGAGGIGSLPELESYLEEQGLLTP